MPTAQIVIETFIGLATETSGACNRVATLSLHHFFYFTQQQFILTLDLDISNLAYHLSFAVIDGNFEGLHELGSDGLDVTHVESMVDVSQLQLFLLHEAIKIRPGTVHNKIIVFTKCNTQITTYRKGDNN